MAWQQQAISWMLYRPGRVGTACGVESVWGLVAASLPGGWFRGPGCCICHMQLLICSEVAQEKGMFEVEFVKSGYRFWDR